MRVQDMGIPPQGATGLAEYRCACPTLAAEYRWIGGGATNFVAPPSIVCSACGDRMPLQRYLPIRDDDTPYVALPGETTVPINDWGQHKPYLVIRSDGVLVLRQIVRSEDPADHGLLVERETPVPYGLTDDALAAIRAIVREEVGARRDEIARIRAVVDIAAGLLEVRTAGRMDKADRALAIAGPLCEAVAALEPEDWRLLSLPQPHDDPS